MQTVGVVFNELKYCKVVLTRMFELMECYFTINCLAHGIRYTLKQGNIVRVYSHTEMYLFQYVQVEQCEISNLQAPSRN